MPFAQQATRSEVVNIRCAGQLLIRGIELEPIRDFLPDAFSQTNENSGQPLTSVVAGQRNVVSDVPCQIVVGDETGVFQQPRVTCRQTPERGTIPHQ